MNLFKFTSLRKKSFVGLLLWFYVFPLILYLLNLLINAFSATNFPSIGLSFAYFKLAYSLSFFSYTIAPLRVIEQIIVRLFLADSYSISYLYPTLTFLSIFFSFFFIFFISLFGNLKKDILSTTWKTAWSFQFIKFISVRWGMVFILSLTLWFFGVVVDQYQLKQQKKTADLEWNTELILSNSSRVQETLLIKEEPQNITGSQYDEILSHYVISFKEGKTTSVGPIALLFSPATFSQHKDLPQGPNTYSSVQIVVGLIPIPNINLKDTHFKKGVIHLIVDHVYDTHGDDVYNSEATERDRGREEGLSYEPREDPFPHFRTKRTIYLKPLHNVHEIKQIKGRIFLQLPVYINDLYPLFNTLGVKAIYDQTNIVGDFFERSYNFTLSL